MRSYLGEYTVPGAEPVEITILVFDKEVHIGYAGEKGKPLTRQWKMQDIQVNFDRATQSTLISNRQQRDMLISIKGNEAAVYISGIKTELDKPWYRRGIPQQWGRNFLLLSVIIGILVVSYLLIVPWMAEKMASTVSMKNEERFGEAVYSALPLASEEDTAASHDVNAFFSALQVPTKYNVRITVVKGETVNAFALPGGRIVVYSALLKQMKTYPELAALLSHEFSHVNNKHSTKSVFRRLGSKIFIGLLFGRLGSVTAVLADNADNLKSLKYSRGLEKEADLEGLKILEERKIDTKGFDDLFAHLKQAASSSSMPAFLASHPDIDKRITYIRQASVNAVPEENTELKTIFEQLKQKLQ